MGSVRAVELQAMACDRSYDTMGARRLGAWIGRGLSPPLSYRKTGNQWHEHEWSTQYATTHEYQLDLQGVGMGQPLTHYTLHCESANHTTGPDRKKTGT